MMEVLVLAGGQGTRLTARVPDLPKPMAPVAGRPFLEYLLDRIVDCGFDRITLSVGYRADLIQAHFGRSYRGARIRYVVETEPLGTGGAVAFAMSQAGDASCLVLNGDTFLDVDLRALLAWYREQPEDIAMVLANVPDLARYGAVTTRDGRVTGFVAKGQSGPGAINAGVYVIRAGVFARFGLEGRFSLESDLLQAHCAALLPRAFVTDAFFIDIGVPEDFDRAQRLFDAARPGGRPGSA